MGDEVIEVRQPGRRPLRVVVGEGVVVGRDCDGLIVVDPGVSRRHVVVEPTSSGLVVRDLGSTNGTLHNGRPVTGAERLGPGDVVVLGATELRMIGPGPPPAVEAAPVDPQATVAGFSQLPAAVRAALAPAEAPDPRTSSIARVADLLEAAQAQRPPLAPDGGDGDTITICFSDIESSTEAALRMGDGRWFDLLAVHDGIVRNNLVRHGGTEVKSQGDGFMLTFPSARRGAQFAVDVQRAMSRWSADHPDEAVRVRMGLHTGEALVSAAGDLFGKHVIVAARVANLADGGEILVSHIVREITSNRGDLDYGEGRLVTLKGIDTPYEVFPLHWA